MIELGGNYLLSGRWEGRGGFSIDGRDLLIGRVGILLYLGGIRACRLETEGGLS